MNEAEEEIHIESYADRRNFRGFQSRFKKTAKKLYLYLPINGPNTKPEDWKQFYGENRTGRTANERGTRVNTFAFYQFLKKRPADDSSNLYYYALPKGFTQSYLVNAETDYSYMIGTGYTIWDFRTEQKVSAKVGLCTLRKRA